MKMSDMMGEADKLREALEEILGYDRQFIIDNETGNCGLGEDGYCATIARAILNGEKTK